MSRITFSGTHLICLKEVLLADDLEEDQTYKPPKRPRPEPKGPAQIFDEDGNEIVETAESGTEDSPNRKVCAKLTMSPSRRRCSWLKTDL